MQCFVGEIICSFYACTSGVKQIVVMILPYAIKFLIQAVFRRRGELWKLKTRLWLMLPGKMISCGCYLGSVAKCIVALHSRRGTEIRTCKLKIHGLVYRGRNSDWMACRLDSGDCVQSIAKPCMHGQAPQSACERRKPMCICEKNSMTSAPEISNPMQYHAVFLTYWTSITHFDHGTAMVVKI